jgi:copper chaperone CopZ
MLETVEGVAAVEADFDRKAATVTMKPGATLTPAQVAKAFEGSKYALVGAIEPVTD